MAFQSVFSAILALLMVGTLINAVTGTPITASAIEHTSSEPIRNTTLAWPSYLPGWGTVTVFREKLADEYNTGMPEQPGALDEIPTIYSIHRPGPGACSNPYTFPDTDAVSGMICLPDGDDYESMAKDLMVQDSAPMGKECGPGGAWGCFCPCIVGCSALGCYACSDRPI
ncbi:hypothetical protein KVR01_011265 [Diaporthe batatas]|uniref:uncharacterized protein n=1 Tax=Diaporthe batatas TaxID=748121 RepID=UPI001D0535BB|nr:uncharacterized protein KVR01_011265 [Diaporthe batatas]KAG8158822.1 hypothetical protein KVR01_011265 [Diaporthe batatas]